MKENSFRLAADIGTSSEKELRKKNKFYYLSTTRHKLGGYNLEPYNQGVMIKLKGEELNKRFTSKAVDYWGHDFRKIRPEKAEAEDRVYHTEPEIPNAKKYIDEVHILYVKPDSYTHENTIRSMRRLLIELKKNDIPHWVYEDTRDFLLQDKRRSVKQPVEYYSPQKKEQPMSYRHRRYYGRELLAWTELVYKNNENQLSKKAKDLLYKLRYHNYNKEVERSLEVDVHNNRTSDPESVAKFIRALRTIKVSSIDDFVDAMQTKWANNK